MTLARNRIGNSSNSIVNSCERNFVKENDYSRGSNLFIMFHLLLDPHQLRWVQKSEIFLHDSARRESHLKWLIFMELVGARWNYDLCKFSQSFRFRFKRSDCWKAQWFRYLWNHFLKQMQMRRLGCIYFSWVNNLFKEKTFWRWIRNAKDPHSHLAEQVSVKTLRTK